MCLYLAQKPCTCDLSPMRSKFGYMSSASYAYLSRSVLDGQSIQSGGEVIQPAFSYTKYDLREYNKGRVRPSIKVIYQQSNSAKMEKSAKLELAQTGLHCEQPQHDRLSPSPVQQVDRLCANIKFYITLLPNAAELQEIKQILLHQLTLLDAGSDQIDVLGESSGQQKCFQNIDEFGRVIKELIVRKEQTADGEEFRKMSGIIDGLVREMQIIIEEDASTLERLENYQIYQNNVSVSNGGKVKPTHYWKKEQIIFKSELPPEVFQGWVQPPLHRLYISEVTKVYHEVVPFKIKHVCLPSLEDPVISTPNYFKPDLEVEKQIIFFCKPGTNKMYSYRMEDICQLLTIEKQYIQEEELAINWNFSSFVRTLITPEGRIFAINCQSSSQKIDPYMYEITGEKVSKRGRLISPKLNCSFIYCNKHLYVMGGNGLNEPCSLKNYCYSFRDKKWKEIADANLAVRKPTLCAFRDRYIVKLGGLNQFDYISKGIEMFDTLTNTWSLVRASPKNVLEEVQILEDSLAAQIREDQIYVFGGKNGNNFQTDTGFVLQFMEIRERNKGAAKVSGDIWNVSMGKKNVYSFFGLFSQSNVVAHHNCLYALRTEFSKSLS